MPQMKPKPAPEPAIAGTLENGPESASISDIFLSPLNDVDVLTLRDVNVGEVVIEAVVASKVLMEEPKPPRPRRQKKVK
jgi:hypothetical protein